MISDHYLALLGAVLKLRFPGQRVCCCLLSLFILICNVDAISVKMTGVCSVLCCHIVLSRTTPKLDEKKDPSEGLMDLLKKMYEDGDDEMKRTIAKSWCESRSKQSGMDL